MTKRNVPEYISLPLNSYKDCTFGDLLDFVHDWQPQLGNVKLKLVDPHKGTAMYERLETDQEYEKRLKREEEQLKYFEERERNQLITLKAKYER